MLCSSSTRHVARPPPGDHTKCTLKPFVSGRRCFRAQRSAACAVQASKPCNAATAAANSALLSGAVAASLLLGCSLTAPALALPETQLESIRQAIDKDFSEGQYYVTGRLTPSLYDAKCIFKDPTTNVKGVVPYTTAVASLFDPAVSHADLISSNVSSSNTITLRWRLEGRLQLGNLNIKPYTGTTVYTVDEDSGLITRHEETWDISALDAFVSTFIPSFGAPPAPPV